MKYKAKWYDSKDLLKMLYVDKQMSQDEIADYLQVSNETVRHLLSKYELRK